MSVEHWFKHRRPRKFHSSPLPLLVSSYTTIFPRGCFFKLEWKIDQVQSYHLNILSLASLWGFIRWLTSHRSKSPLYARCQAPFWYLVWYLNYFTEVVRSIDLVKVAKITREITEEKQTEANSDSINQDPRKMALIVIELSTELGYGSYSLRGPRPKCSHPVKSHTAAQGSNKSHTGTA